MPLWSDNFDRADGVLGSNWATVSGSVSIASNKARSVGGALIKTGAVTGPNAAVATVTVPLTSDIYNCAGPAVKIPAVLGNYYYATALVGSGIVTYAIRFNQGNPGTVLGSYVWTGTPPASVTLRLEYNAGVLRLYADGTLMCSATSSTFAANPGIGINWVGNAQSVDDFSASGDGAPQLIITPRVVGVDDGDTLISLLGVAVVWTPGTPGSPSFTVNDGALSSQQISTTTNATVLFSPPTTPGTVTLADTVNGISATITVVAGSYLGGGTGGTGGMSSAVVDWLALQAAHAGLILTDADTTDGAVSGDYLKVAIGNVQLVAKSGSTPTAPYIPTADLINSLWAGLWGGFAPLMISPVSPAADSAMYAIQALATALATMTDSGTVSLAGVENALLGSNVIDNSTLMDAIGNIVPGGDVQPVLDALAELRGDTTTTLYTLLSSLAGIRTTHVYSLGDVMDAIGNIPSSSGEAAASVVAVMAALAALALSTAGVGTAVGAVGLDVLSTAGTIGGIVADVAVILSNLAALQASIDALTTPAAGVGAPLWPGTANVTLGTSHALADDLTITEPMDGVLVTITGHPAGAGHYGFASRDSWVHAGAVVFISDRGDVERPDSIGLDAQILTPRTMQKAASAIFRVNSGFTGTARSWNRTT